MNSRWKKWTKNRFLKTSIFKGSWSLCNLRSKRLALWKTRKEYWKEGHINGDKCCQNSNLGTEKNFAIRMSPLILGEISVLKEWWRQKLNWDEVKATHWNEDERCGDSIGPHYTLQSQACWHIMHIQLISGQCTRVDTIKLLLSQIILVIFFFQSLRCSHSLGHKGMTLIPGSSKHSLLYYS